MEPRQINIATIEAHLGKELGHSAWRTISQDDVNAFADVTGDHQWIHTDPARAAEGPFGGTIVHGYLTLSLIPVLAGEIYRLTGARMTVNYGLNRARFPAPVSVGTRVRLIATPINYQAQAGGGTLTSRMTIESEDSDKPACVAETVTLVRL